MASKAHRTSLRQVSTTTHSLIIVHLCTESTLPGNVALCVLVCARHVCVKTVQVFALMCIFVAVWIVYTSLCCLGDDS